MTNFDFVKDSFELKVFSWVLEIIFLSIWFSIRPAHFQMVKFLWGLMF